VRKIITEELVTFLGFCALLLGIINGLILFRNYIRDRPKLTVYPIHPDVYQWYFELPLGVYQGNPTRKYGFLIYIAITNRGLRDVSIDYWHLFLKTIQGDKIELKPLTIIEPKIKIGKMADKTYPVLGIKGIVYEGDTMVKSGDSISGFAYYIAEFYGNPKEYGLIIENETTKGEIVVKSVFENRAKTKIRFRKIELSRVQEMIPEIETIDK